MIDRIYAQTSLFFKLKILGIANNMAAKQNSLLPTPFIKHWKMHLTKTRHPLCTIHPKMPQMVFFCNKKDVLILKELKELVFTTFLL